MTYQMSGAKINSGTCIRRYLSVTPFVAVIVFGFYGCYEANGKSADIEEADPTVDEIAAEELASDDVQPDEVVLPDLDVRADDDRTDDVPADDSGEDEMTEEEPVCEHPCETDDDCDDDNPCTDDRCPMLTKCCNWFTDGVDPEACSDGIFCNGIEYCHDGDCRYEDACAGIDCGECCDLICDEERDICLCVEDPYYDCDDGLFCTGELWCIYCYCCGYEPPCPYFHEDPCWMWDCNEEEDRCEEAPRLDGEQCSDEDPCDGTEFCWDGVCTGPDGHAVMPPCVDGDPCTQDICDPETFECENPEILGCGYCDDPSVCDDDDPCTDDYCHTIDGGDLLCDHIFYPPSCPPA